MCRAWLRHRAPRMMNWPQRMSGCVLKSNGSSATSRSSSNSSKRSGAQENVKRHLSPSDHRSLLPERLGVRAAKTMAFTRIAPFRRASMRPTTRCCRNVVPAVDLRARLCLNGRRLSIRPRFHVSNPSTENSTWPSAIVLAATVVSKAGTSYRLPMPWVQLQVRWGRTRSP